MSNTTTDKEALDYHSYPKAGKLEVVPTVPFETQKDMSLAYTPGVAVPCLAIEANPEDAYKYTAKSNLVGVLTNGTAVLGLGNIGALASKPVMEGKAILFKKFSGVNSFDIEIDEIDVERFCEVAAAIAPTFGGINLEDIKAPECFEIERKLVDRLDIPVMHDDQHGTAIISSAGMLNACVITGREVKKLKVVIIGAGAAAISCARMYRFLGVEHITMIDSKGVIHKARTDLNEYKLPFAITCAMTQEEACVGADMILGLSKPGSISEQNIKDLAPNPILFTLANPTPEIHPDVVDKLRDDVIHATGRSDFDNQVNNVLGFPFIFRGALDVRARAINEQMKAAAAMALADLAKQKVPDYIHEVYGKNIEFGPHYIIPKPFDKRLIVEVSSAVAKAAFDSGVARVEHFDLKAYRKELEGYKI